MWKVVKINKVFILWLLIMAGLFSEFSVVCAKSKKKPVEKIYTWDDTMWKTRRHYGMIAKNVTEVKVEKFENYETVYIRKRGENTVKEVDMYKRNPGKNQNYKMHIVGKKIKEFYPLGSAMLFLDAKNRLRLNGSNCYLFANHVSAKECKKEKYYVVNRIVERNLNPKKCWSDSGMFAYVKNNNLYITGYPAVPNEYDVCDEPNCYRYKKPRMFFQGKGNQVKDVVCGDGTGSYRYNFFVLLKDGSVWGMGNNVAKLISNSKTKYFDDFVQIVTKGVKQISVSSNNVAVVKDNGDLYVWGHTMKSRSSKKYKNSVIPRKIATNVIEADISGREDTTLIFLKKNGVAYGMGLNSGCILTDKYKSGWYKKPVKLMEKAKHVYAIEGVTFILKNNRSLYWTGTQDWNVNFGWVAKKLSKK